MSKLVEGAPPIGAPSRRKWIPAVVAPPLAAAHLSEQLIEDPVYLSCAEWTASVLAALTLGWTVFVAGRWMWDFWWRREIAIHKTAEGVWTIVIGPKKERK